MSLVFREKKSHCGISELLDRVEPSVWPWISLHIGAWEQTVHSGLSINLVERYLCAGFRWTTFLGEYMNIFLQILPPLFAKNQNVRKYLAQSRPSLFYSCDELVHYQSDASCSSVMWKKNKFKRGAVCEYVAMANSTRFQSFMVFQMEMMGVELLRHYVKWGQWKHRSM